ncbi:hypothetical protein DMC47_25130 [Nostoc sp. 3335mG]|nr:hypothetical protein DMC47_25130 [Nostoc sp. 3335mG]
MRWMILGVAAVTLAGCVPRSDGPGDRPVAIEGDSVTYATGPCFGACPVYSVTLRPDGSGTFTGKRFTKVEGERAFKTTPAAYQAFLARLQPYRPESGVRRYEHGAKGCEQPITDMPSVDITWTRMIGDSQQLYYYFGCNREQNRAMADALGNAPDAIPELEALIGERP